MAFVKQPLPSLPRRHYVPVPVLVICAGILLFALAVTELGRICLAQSSLQHLKCPQQLEDHRPRRRSAFGVLLLGAVGSLEPAQAKRSAGRTDVCACCEIDWCVDRCRYPGKPFVKCDCHSYLRDKGFAVPLDAPQASVSTSNGAGLAAFYDSLAWKEATLPRWKPVAADDLEVAESKIRGAGLGVFAKATLPQWTVLGPYQGAQLTSADVKRKRYTPEMDYVWCPRRTESILANASDEELDMTPASLFCVDAKPAVEGNMPRYVNAAKNKAQCAGVNVELCELGQVAYYRTTQPVPMGTELMTDYGVEYWEGFSGC